MKCITIYELNCCAIAGATGKETAAKAGDARDAVRYVGQEDALQEEMGTSSSTLAWKIPRTEKPGGLPTMGSQRTGHN